jgi:hypothetical protein
LSEHKISVKLEVNNIGPHYGSCKLRFSAEVDSNKAIFYALNGTGKSFISRSIQLLSGDKTESNADDLLTIGQDSGLLTLTIASLFPPSEEKKLSISINRESPANIQNDSGFIFHVFNSDFVEENIKARDYMPDGNIEGYILGKSRIDLNEDRKREKYLQAELDEANKGIELIIEEAKKELRNQEIRTKTFEFSLIDKNKLQQNEVTESIQSFDTIVQQLESLASLPEEIPDIATPVYTANNSLFDAVYTLLNTTYPQSTWDEEFVSNIKRHRNLVETGLSAYSDTEAICPFCKQPMSESALDLIKKYRAFFSDKEALVLKEIADKTADINAAVTDIKMFEQSTKNANAEIVSLKQFFPSLKDLSLRVPVIDSNGFACFYELTNVLQKKSENIHKAEFSVQSIIEECKNCTDSILKHHKDNEIMISEVNKIKQNSNSERLKLRRDLCKAQYLRLKSSKELSDLINMSNKLIQEVEGLQKSIIEKEKNIRVSKKGKVYETLKFFLNRFFAGKYTIDRDTFQIKFLGSNVGRKATKILSDGEKGIVAFCVYLASTHLLISREDDYNKLFFIIDDPISSMDFHYVYVVAQSLRDIKACFGISLYERMWVFTHNLEFFSILSRNHIVSQAFIMKPGIIEPWKHQLLMPYESHLKDILDIANLNLPPMHTSGNSIRYILETVCKFEYPDKSLSTYISENPILSDNSCIFTLCQDLSHGNIRIQPPCSPEVIIGACKAVMEFMKSRYNGQVDAIQSLAVKGE